LGIGEEGVDIRYQYVSSGGKKEVRKCRRKGGKGLNRRASLWLVEIDERAAWFVDQKVLLSVPGNMPPWQQ
jgi:hypothetical protein